MAQLQQSQEMTKTPMYLDFLKKLDVIDEDDFASVMTDSTYRGGAIATKSRNDQDTYAPTYEKEDYEDDFASVMTDPTYRGGAIATKSRNDEDTYASIHENERSYVDFASVMTDPTYRGGAMATKSRNDEDTYASIYEDETSSRSRFSNSTIFILIYHYHSPRFGFYGANFFNY